MSAWLMMLTAAAGPLSGNPFFRQAEDSLSALAWQIVVPPDDKGRLENNRQFTAYFKEVLQLPGAFDHPFDSLQTVSFLYSPGRDFRIISWYVPLQGQQFEYFGLLQFSKSSENGDSLIVFSDASRHINGREQGELDAGSWYGAFYYQISCHPLATGDICALLGWKGDNPFTRKRVIEPLTIQQGRPVFGKAVFDQEFETAHRVVFEYSARVSMSLDIEQELVYRGEPLNEVIVFDRLVPAVAGMEGQYRFYVPEANVFDGMVFEAGRWRLIRDLDVRMPDRD